MKRYPAASGRFRPRFRFVGETIAELKKVVWPSRREAIHLTTIVIIIAAFVGLILGAIDYGFTWLVNGVFLMGQ